jgi:ABC-2 type transport system ATP-binding protein
MNTPALKIDNLIKSYSGVTVVDNISLEIQHGEIFGLLGPNGAGKSTTINMISGVSTIDHGTISVYGHDNQTDFKATRSMTGVMHQELVPELSFPVDEALKMHSGYYGFADDPEWRELLISKLDLHPHREKRYRSLSGGMKRRFMVAKALIHRPRLLILDEPTAGVDVELRHTLWEFVRDINKAGTTILLTTHYLEEAESMCDRIAIMNFGEIVALESTSDLVNKIGERKLVLSFQHPITNAAEIFSSFELQCSPDAKTAQFRITRGTEIMEIVDQAKASGIKIDDLNTIAPDLEDVFLKITSKKQEQGSA